MATTELDFKSEKIKKIIVQPLPLITRYGTYAVACILFVILILLYTLPFRQYCYLQIQLEKWHNSLYMISIPDDKKISIRKGDIILVHSNEDQTNPLFISISDIVSSGYRYFIVEIDSDLHDNPANNCELYIETRDPILRRIFYK